jgi:acetyl esterase/lipase
MKKILFLVFYFPFLVYAAKLEPDRFISYKTIDGIELKLHVFEPAGHQSTDQSSAIIFFFGGGWSSGDPKQFYEQARFLADRGMVAMSAEYRVKSRNNTTPFEAVKDAKSAVRWVRQHAKELGVDPDKIVASGGSAGGHIACCTGVIEKFDEAGEDLSVSSVPNSLILFNPVLDTTEKGYGRDKVGTARMTEISPCHHVHSGIIPTLLMHGTADHTVPFENAERFARLMKEAGNECVLVAFEGMDHGFFNGSLFRPKSDETNFNLTMKQTVGFLQSHRYLIRNK